MDNNFSNNNVTFSPCKDFTITIDNPPKKKYYRYRINDTKFGGWYSPVYYIDDDGYQTNGNEFRPDWNKLEKQKIENDFVEV